MTNNIKNYIENNLRFEYDKSICERFADYTHCKDSYISDIISEIADSDVDIYTCDLLKWLRENGDAISDIEDSVSEFGLPDSRNFDFIQLLRQGQYYQKEHILYTNECDCLVFWALSYCLDNNIELTDTQIEELDEYLRTANITNTSDIITKIEEMTK